MPSPVDINRRLTEAEVECRAQLRLIEILKPLQDIQRQRVMAAAKGLIDVDALVGGVLDAFLRSKSFISRSRRPGKPSYEGIIPDELLATVLKRGELRK
jgi:hypothetical protein